MLLATSIVFFRVFTYGKSESEARKWAIGVISYLIILSIYHCWAAEKLIHNITFIGSVILISIRTRAIIRERVHDLVLKKQLFTMARVGSCMSGLGLLKIIYLANSSQTSVYLA